LKVTIDPQRCTGHALCFAYASDVFVSDELGHNVTGCIELPDAAREKMLRAAASCPEIAIAVEESDT